MIDPDNTVFSVDTANYVATMQVEVLPKQGGGYYVKCPDTDVGKGQKKVKLRWEMITDGWKILDVHGLSYPVFVDKSKDGFDYKCKDKNSSKAEYKYTIVVGNATTELVLLLDPTIRNGGQ